MRDEDARQMARAQRGDAAIACDGRRAPNDADTRIDQIRLAVDDNSDGRTKTIGVGIRRARAENDELRARRGSLSLDNGEAQAEQTDDVETARSDQ